MTLRRSLVDAQAAQIRVGVIFYVFAFKTDTSSFMRRLRTYAPSMIPWRCGGLSLGSPGLPWALRARLGSPGLPWAPLGSPRLPWALLGSLGSPGLPWASLGSPGLSSGSSGLSWTLLCSSGLVWALLGSSGLFWALLGSSGLSWALLARLGSSVVHVVIL